MRILIVEDDEHAARALAELLEMDGHTATFECCVEGARRALAKIQYDVALIDVNLPDGDGRSLIRDARSTGAKVYVTTGSTTLVPRTAIGGRPAWAGDLPQADGRVTKPIDYPKFLELISRISPHRS